jgi:hypothetical protein
MTSPMTARMTRGPYGSGLGLTEVDTEALRKLLRAVHRGDVQCPLTPVGLVALGLQDSANLILGHLRNLSQPAVHAVLVAVLAERGPQPG